MNKATIEKYQIPTPRYTSYPTVPYWEKECPSVESWFKTVRETVDNQKPIGVYIHLPFCENLCTYCGCHKRITKNHKVESPYINSLIKEWDIYKKAAFQRPALIEEIHLGGGTPTFFAPDQIKKLIENITAGQVISENASFSFEAHPADTTIEHLEILYQIGFDRISIGVQEFSEHILKTINRRQTTKQVVDLVNGARATGFSSINFDLLYGLPHQTISDINIMMDKIDELRPERIAFYGYAHVPWIKPSQRAYGVEHLPKGMDRWNFFEQGKKRLLEMGYQQIGIDHFSLPSDELLIANNDGSLHRNFMGYTAKSTELLIGLGASSISDSWNMYVQNEKGIETYQELVDAGQLPIVKGHQLTKADQIHRQHILNIMCQYKTNWADPSLQTEAFFQGLERLKSFEEEGFITIDFQLKSIRVLEAGRPFIRNIAMMLDTRYWLRRETNKLQFSQAL